MFTLDKEKYFEILRNEGLSAAITALHRDSSEWEYDTFEGQKGWQPDMYEKLEEVRKFSRELWDKLLEKNPTYKA